MRRKLVFVLSLSALLSCLLCVRLNPVGAEASFGYLENCCLSYDGTDDYISCGSPDIYVYRAEKITVEFWMKPKYTIESGSDALYGSTDGAVISYTESWCGSGGWALYFDFTNGKLIFRYKRDVFSPVSIGSTRNVWDADAWYHVAVSFDASPSVDSLVFYVNGTIDRVFNDVYNIGYENSYLKIGGYIANEYMFGGLIDEIRFWNIYKTQSEIQSVWNRILNETESVQPELIGYWRFDEGFGSTSQDHSTENNNATLALPPYNPTWVDLGAPIIPEFPSFLILPLFMIATLLAVIVYRRKQF